MGSEQALVQEHTVGFRVVADGYDCSAVDQRVHALESDLADVLAQLDAIETSENRPEPAGPLAVSGATMETRTGSPAVRRTADAALAVRGERMVQVAVEEASQLGISARMQAEELTARTAERIEQLRAASAEQTAKLLTVAAQQAADLRQATAAEVAIVLDTATRRAGEVLRAAQRESARIRAGAEHQASLARAVADRELSKRRVLVEVEVTRARAGAKQETDAARAAARVEAAQVRAAAQACRDDAERAVTRLTGHTQSVLLARLRQAAHDMSHSHARRLMLTRHLTLESHARITQAEQRCARATQTIATSRRSALTQAQALVQTARHQLQLECCRAHEHADKVLTDARDRARGRLRRTAGQVEELAQRAQALEAELDQLAMTMTAASNAAPVGTVTSSG